ncbi:hypothetical protein [Roseicella aquatilis]|uniref:Uncharacterized protein n=1 Tax=Roseicella aquatilis TaxID=2527868 RepID=A0A4R4DZL9_9PROT|nr:hypothetical protein [Roseicella aquatilis]TCZ66856.1 hypothetical protein EXY23_01755 [Roseicella aquatilis]
MWRDFLDGWIGLRARWRGYGLPIFASPLLPAGLIAAIGGDESIVLGAALGFGASLLAARLLRRGRQGDTNRAAWITAAGTGLAAHFAAGLGTVFPFVMAAGALFGTRMMYQALPETAPPPPPPEPPPPPGLVEESRARLARIGVVAQRRADWRLQGVAAAMDGVLDDLDARPDRLPMARRFLTVQLDGLDRIVQRLEAGAAPPESLPPLLDELTRSAGALRQSLAHEETEALDIQVKVLSDRLREEGYR